MPHNLRKIEDSALLSIFWVKLKINAVNYILVLRNKNLKEQEMYIFVSSTTGAKNLIPTLKIKHLWVNCCRSEGYIVTNRRTSYTVQPFWTVQNHTEPFCLQVIISEPGNTGLIKIQCMYFWSKSGYLALHLLSITLESGILASYLLLITETCYKVPNVIITILKEIFLK